MQICWVSKFEFSNFLKKYFKGINPGQQIDIKQELDPGSDTLTTNHFWNENGKHEIDPLLSTLTKQDTEEFEQGIIRILMILCLYLDDKRHILTCRIVSSSPTTINFCNFFQGLPSY